MRGRPLPHTEKKTKGFCGVIELREVGKRQRGRDKPYLRSKDRTLTS